MMDGFWIIQLGQPDQIESNLINLSLTWPIRVQPKFRKMKSSWLPRVRGQIGLSLSLLFLNLGWVSHQPD